MLNIKIVSWSLGIFTAISFVLCVIYGLIVPPSLHGSVLGDGFTGFQVADLWGLSAWG